MSVQDTMVVEPGWYPDPADGERLRWWSGVGWTDHLSPPVSSSAEEAGAAEEPGMAQVAELPVASVESVVPIIPGSRRAARLARESGDGAQAPAAPTPIAHAVVAKTPAIPDPDPEPQLELALDPEPEPELDPDPDPEPDPDLEPSMAIPAVDPWWVPVTADGELTTSPAAAEWRPVPVRKSWNTPEAWLLSALLLISTAIAAGAYLFAASVSVSMIPAPSGLLVLIASIVLARKDRRALDEKGVAELPSLWWLLLGPTFYLGARAFAVLRVGGKAWAPFWVALASNVACIVVAFVIGFLSAVATVPVTTAAVEQTIEADLAAQGYAWQLECPESVDVYAGSPFSCELLDGEASVVTVDISADGEPTYSAE